jgi:hypothetical protein
LQGFELTEESPCVRIIKNKLEHALDFFIKLVEFAFVTLGALPLAG